MIPNDSWYDAIAKRHAHRTFNGQPIDERMADHLIKTCDRFYMSEAHAVFSTENVDDVFTGVVGSYGKIKGAPAYIAFIGDTGDPNYQEKVGYIGEGILLEAVSQGLDTRCPGHHRADGRARHCLGADVLAAGEPRAPSRANA